MSDLTNSDPIEEDSVDGQETHSSWSMGFTMLLLIAGFLFASALLVRQTLSARNVDGEPLFQLSQFLEKGKELAARAQTRTPAVSDEEEGKSSPFEDIKQIVNIQPSENVRWPRLKLTGFGKSTESNEGFAIINGDLVHPGEYAGKVKLVDIRSHDVVVEYKGEQKTLTVGMDN